MRYNMRKIVQQLYHLKDDMNQTLRLKQLYTLLKMIDEATLGNDWESRAELKKIREATIKEIKQIESSERPPV